VGVPRGGIINRVGGVKIVAKGEVGRANATLGVTRTTHATEPHRGEITCTAASAAMRVKPQSGGQTIARGG
jgi:hypothetical protein